MSAPGCSGAGVDAPSHGSTEHEVRPELGQRLYSVGCKGLDAPQQTSYAGCPNSHYWKLGPTDIEWQPDPDRRYGETVGE